MNVYVFILLRRLFNIYKMLGFDKKISKLNGNMIEREREKVKEYKKRTNLRINSWRHQVNLNRFV